MLSSRTRSESMMSVYPRYFCRTDRVEAAFQSSGRCVHEPWAQQQPFRQQAGPNGRGAPKAQGGLLEGHREKRRGRQQRT